MSDSCAILFVNLPGEYRLSIGQQHLHGNDVDVLFSQLDPAVAESAASDSEPSSSPYALMEEKAGPGMPLQTFLPKGTYTLY